MQRVQAGEDGFQSERERPFVDAAAVLGQQVGVAQVRVALGVQLGVLVEA